MKEDDKELKHSKDKYYEVYMVLTTILLHNNMKYRHNEDLRDLFKYPNVVAFVKNKLIK